MNEFFLTKLQVVFFLKTPISSNQILDMAIHLKQELNAEKIQINNSLSVPPEIPAPFPLLVAEIPDHWKIVINANRIDCIKNIQFGTAITDTTYQRLESVYSQLLSQSEIIRMGSVAQFYDVSQDAENKLKEYLFNKNSSDIDSLNSLAFMKSRKEQGLSFYDNFQIVKEQMMRRENNLNSMSSSLKITRDLNTGQYITSFSEEILKKFFLISQMLFDFSCVKGVVYGNNN